MYTMVGVKKHIQITYLKYYKTIEEYYRLKYAIIEVHKYDVKRPGSMKKRNENEVNSSIKCYKVLANLFGRDEKKMKIAFTQAQ